MAENEKETPIARLRRVAGARVNVAERAEAMAQAAYRDGFFENERELKELACDIRETIDDFMAVANDEIDEAIARLSAAERENERLALERDHWKANHDNQVKLRAALMDRPDLQERAAKVQAMEAENDRLRASIEGALRITSLWLLGDDVSPEHEGEASALDSIYRGFLAALTPPAEGVGDA
jgi:hypothetical protein